MFNSKENEVTIPRKLRYALKGRRRRQKQGLRFPKEMITSGKKFELPFGLMPSRVVHFVMKKNTIALWVPLAEKGGSGGTYSGWRGESRSTGAEEAQTVAEDETRTDQPDEEKISPYSVEDGSRNHVWELGRHNLLERGKSYKY